MPQGQGASFCGENLVFCGYPNWCVRVHACVPASGKRVKEGGTSKGEGVGGAVRWN